MTFYYYKETTDPSIDSKTRMVLYEETERDSTDVQVTSGPLVKDDTSDNTLHL